LAVTKVVMPKLSEQMESGKVIKWLKKEGDRVQSGDILAEVETDKADVEMEAFGAGVLRKILVPAAARAGGSLIGVIAEANDDINSVVGQAGAPAPAAEGGAKAPSEAAASSDANRHGRPAGGGAAAAQERGPGGAQAVAVERPRGAGEPARAESGRPAANAVGRVKASPLARKIAAQSGVDLNSSRAAGPAAASSAVTSRPIHCAGGGRGGGARATSGDAVRHGPRVRGRRAQPHARGDRQADAAQQGARPPLLRSRQKSRWIAPGTCVRN